MITSTCSRQPRTGSIGLVSHSGALAFTTFFERGEDEGAGFAYNVSTGNEVDQTLTDYVEYMGASDRVDVITAYIEGFDEPRRFMQVADEVTRQGTPVLAIKVGRSDRADAATVTHGFSDGQRRRMGDCVRPDGCPTRRGYPASPRERESPRDDGPAGVQPRLWSSTSGGLASLLADLADVRGLELPALSDDTERALIEHDGLLTFGSVPNPIDIRGYGADHSPKSPNCCSRTIPLTPICSVSDSPQLTTAPRTSRTTS